MAVRVYGIANCDTVKKARAWLAEAGIEAVFHDYKKQGVDAALLAAWVDRFGWDRLLNRSGTTFRKLPDEDKTDLTRERAIALMLAHPSAIRRPVLVHGNAVEGSIRRAMRCCSNPSPIRRRPAPASSKIEKKRGPGSSPG